MKIGIAMAVYRPEPDFFFEQIESIQNQRHRNFVAVLMFDSPMHAFRIDKRFQRFIEDPRFIWLENTARLGVKKNFEQAVQRVLNEGVSAISCSDQDDIWCDTKLEVCVRELKKSGPKSLVHSNMHVRVGGKNLPQTAWVLMRWGVNLTRIQHLLVRNIVAGAGMLFDAELARLYPVIPAGVPYHDYWYALVASYHGGIFPIREPLYAYRQHSRNVIGFVKFESLFSLHKIVPKNPFRKCVRVYKTSKGLALSAEEAHILGSSLWKIVFLRPYDMGMGFLLMGLFHLIKDRPLSRACFARSLGKFLSVLGVD